MTNVDEPFRFPDLNDVLEMERIVNQGDENKTAAQLEKEIACYISCVQDQACELIRAEKLVLGDAKVLRSAVRLMQTSLRHLFALGEMLPWDQSVRYLTRLKLTIMAVYNIGGFTHIQEQLRMLCEKAPTPAFRKRGPKRLKLNARRTRRDARSSSRRFGVRQGLEPPRTFGENSRSGGCSHYQRPKQSEAT
jgi:hypothetical protein